MATPTAIELLKTRVELASQAQTPKWDLFTDFDEIYHVKGKPQESEAQMHSPDSWAFIETVVPRMVSQRAVPIFHPRPTPFNDQRTEEEKQRSSEVKLAIWEHWWDKDDAFTKNVAWVKGAFRHGTKMVKTGWKYEVQEVSNYEYGEDGRPVVDPATGKFVETLTEEVTFDDATMDTISNYDFMIDPEAKDIQSAAWIIFRYRKTLSELKEYGNFTNLKELDAYFNSERGDSTQAERSRYISGMGVLEDDSTIERVTCYEMWQKGKKGIEKCTIAAMKVQIEKWRPNPFKHRKYPFIRLLDSLTDEEFWGKGEIEPNRYEQYALDTLKSMDIANRVKAIEPKWKISGNVDEWELFNGNVIHADTSIGEDAVPIEIPDYTKTSQPAIEATKANMSQTLGIFDINRGESTAQNTTAGGINTVAEEGNRRFGMKIQMYEQALKELAEQIISLYQQHKTDYFNIDIKDANGIPSSQTVAPIELAGEDNIEIESGSSRAADKQAERNDALQMYQLTQPVQQQDPEFAMESLKFVLKKFDGSKQLVESLDAAYQRIQQAQQAQMQQEQMMQENQMAQEEQMAGEAQASAAEESSVADHQTYMQSFSEREKQLLEKEKLAMSNQPVPA